MISPTLRVTVVLLTTFGWLVSLTAPLWHDSFEPPAQIHLVYMVIVGSAMAVGRSPSQGQHGQQGGGMLGTLTRVLGALHPPPPEPEPPPEPPAEATAAESEPR